jgi:serine protease
VRVGRRELTVLATAGATTLLALTVPANAASHASAANPVKNPYSPAYGHAYRHGVTPTIATLNKMNAWAKAHHNATTAATGPETLSYGGGVDGIGVQSGHSKVYLVFYGTQWGTQTTTNGISSFSGDPDHAAEAAQNMFKGIGTNNELWSADLTQWCDGPNVATGATSCPSNAAFIPYQSGGVLAGVWYDNSAASPSSATGHQLGQEAVNAAAHFGNTTAASNRYAYYVILSPHGTNPDNYQSPTTGYCAWHDYNGDTTLTGGAVSSPYGDIAFSNQPYNMDVGQNCGVNFVNSGSAGTLDGYTMTLGHEWHEEMSDQNPAGGWTNHTGSSYNGEENSDECAWIAPGQPGGAANITFATGTFAEQASWSNDTNACAISHPIVGGGSTSNTVTVTNPGNQTGTVGTAASLQIHATDSASGQTLTYSASGLPAGLSINSSTGLISGTPTTAGTYNVTVTATDTTNASGSTGFTWTINPSSGGCASPGQKLGNPGFESGNTVWSSTSGVIGQYGSSGEPPHSGTWDAWLDGYGTTHTDTLSQSVTIPSGCSATLSFWLHIDTAETTTTTAYDKLTVTLGSTTLATYSNLNANSGYVQKSFNVSSFAGQTVTLKFTGSEDVSLQTSFVIDDTAVNVS